MTETKGPNQWAFRLTRMLNQTLGEDHFPIDVKMVAREFSRQFESNQFLFAPFPLNLAQGTLA